MAKMTNGRRRPAPELKPRRKNPLASAGTGWIDYKNVAMLRTFISERGKIRSRRVTGLTPQQQRLVAAAIKNAREMALLHPGSNTR